MKDCDKIKNALIDEFYNESQGKTPEIDVYSGVSSEFKSVLSSTSKKLDVLNEDIFDFHIDTLSIIEQGEYIREARKTKKEFILFIVSSFIILSLYSIAIIKMGSRMLIISQILIVIITPWIVIPVLAMKEKRSEG